MPRVYTLYDQLNTIIGTLSSLQASSSSSTANSSITPILLTNAYDSISIDDLATFTLQPNTSQWNWGFSTDYNPAWGGLTWH